MEPIDIICFQISATQKVDLTPEELANFREGDTIVSQINEMLEDKIRKSVEGKCNKNGLVLKGSTKIINREVGFVPKGHFNGNFVYSVNYQTLVCNPSVGVVIPCRVIAKNKIGPLANFVHFLNTNVEEEGSDMTKNIDKQFRKYPMIIKVPRELHRPEEQPLFEEIEVGRIIYVEVLGKKFELEDKQISVVAKLSSEEEYLKQLNL